ncbi:hypothetical protein MMC28_005635 [Mycoblastus sanguinarius]|nr:hypothetical protein [Mycoblastus sanguinarius]
MANSESQSASGSWPVRPGLKSILESGLDTRSDEEIVFTLQQYRPVTSEKNVWAFWHSGFLQAPPWVQRTVINWARRLPSWTIRVLDKLPQSPLNVYHFIDSALLPDAFNKNAMTGDHTGPHSADLIRLPLLFLHGGVWMDVGTLLFRDLDDICWRALENPQSPYEMAGFTIQQTDGHKTFLNSFIAARKGNAFIKRWLHIYLEIWKGATEQTGMHGHPLLKHQHFPQPLDNCEFQDGDVKSEHPDPMPSLDEAISKQLEFNSTASKPDEQTVQFQRAISDYGAQWVCFDRLSRLEDPSDGFSGPKFLNSCALLFDAMQECMLAQKLTAWDGEKQFEYLATRKQSGNEEAEMFAETLVRESCQMKVSHGIKALGITVLGNLWDQPDNRDADHAEGTFAAYLRYASIYLEQTREMKSQPWGEVWGKILRLGVTEVGEI